MINFSLYAVRNDNEIFLQAQQAYENNELQKALDLYKTIESKGDVVWFNMGICALDQGDKAQALYYLYQAKKLASPKTFAQIQQLLMNVDHQNQSIGSSFLNFLQLHSTYLMVGGWQFIVLIELFWFLLVWFFARRWYRILLIGVALIIFYCSILLLLAYKRTTDTPAIVKIDQAPLFIAPNEQLARIGMLERGTPVIVLKKEDSWYKICYLKKKGWMHADNFIE